MEDLVWVFGIVLGVVFLATGFTKAYRYEKARDLFPWVSDLPEIIVKIIGGLEILGVAGFFLPMVTNALTWLAPIAAGSLSMLMLMAVVFQVRRHDTDTATLNGLLAIMSLVLTYLLYLKYPIM